MVTPLRLHRRIAPRGDKAVHSGMTIMASLKPNQLDHLKHLLYQREQVLYADLRRETEFKDDYAQVASEAPDLGDASFADLTIDLGNAAMTRDIAALHAIKAARTKIDAGTYGSCVDCGYDIPHERLLAHPTAERCAPCQEQYERTHGGVSRGATL